MDHPENITSLNPPTRSEVQARVDANLAGWRRAIAGRFPRLFFNNQSWAEIKGRHRASVGIERGYFDSVMAKAATIAAAPIAEYETPDEISRRTGMLPFEALQELWMRGVGNDMVVLATALVLEENDSFRTRLRKTALAACAYPQWGLGFDAPNCDLAAGHVARGIAIAYDWHPSIWNESDRSIIRETIRARMNAMASVSYGGIFWSGKYLENHHNVNMAGVGLCGLAFLDEIPEAAEWTALALCNFERVATECNADGSSEEGVPYWSYGMSYTLQYIEGVRHILPTRAFYDHPYFRNSIATRLHASTPDLSGTTPWGDAPPRDYYGPHHLLYRLADEYHDGAGQFLANHLPYSCGDVDGHEDAVWAALWFNASIEGKPPAAMDYLAPVAGMISSRSGWSTTDYQLCFKAGITNRNHSHLDAGALAVCVGNEWLLKTPGYGKGKGEPEFWDNDGGGRWNFFSNATESHSALLINGRNQRFAPGARGRIDVYRSNGEWMWASADLTQAYDGVSRVRRDVLHRRGDYVIVIDEVDAPESVTVEWLAQVPPSATASNERLVVKGRNGRLDIRAASPSGLRFQPRLPSSRHIDVDPDHLKTFAVSQTGTTVQFITGLFITRGPTEALGESAIDVDHSAGLIRLTVRRAGWQDEIAIDSAFKATRRIGDRVSETKFAREIS